MVIQKKQKETLPELVQPDLPDSCRQVWGWFIKLHKKRQSGMGVNPISWESIRAFFDLIDVEPEEWELHLIDRFDDIVLEQYAKQQKQENAKRKTKNSKT